jgi:hypothetical protein
MCIRIRNYDYAQGPASPIHKLIFAVSVTSSIFMFQTNVYHSAGGAVLRTQHSTIKNERLHDFKTNIPLHQVLPLKKIGLHMVGIEPTLHYKHRLHPKLRVF